MNQGHVPDQIVEKLGPLPPHLAAYPTTGIQGYGSVPHASGSIYAWYLGFNTGEVTEFDPAPYQLRQRGYVAAMGGADRVMELAREAMARDDDRWAIELIGYLVRSDPENRTARRLSAEAHRRQAARCENATWRNWYLTAAEELDGGVPVDVGASARDIQLGLPLDTLLRGLAVRLRAELTWYVEQSLSLHVGGAGGRRLHPAAPPGGAGVAR